jgi:O-antigen ligase
MNRLAYPCALVFAASAFVLPALANAALILTAVLLLASPKAAAQALRGHPLGLVLPLALGYLLLHAAVPAATGGLSADARSALLDVLKLLLLIPIGWVVAGDPRRARWLLALAGAGLLLRLLIHTPPGQWLAALRLDFGMTAIGSGLYCGAALLGLLLLWPGQVPAGGWGRPAALIGGLLAATLLATALLLGRSRGAWLALLLSLPVALSGVLAAPGSRRRLPLAVLGAAALAVLLMGGAALTRRLGDDAPAYAALAQALGARDATAADAAWEQMPDDSVGLRLQVWRLSAAAWRQRPWFGHGAGASEALLADAGDPALGDLAHLHNTYMEIALRFGLVGLLLAGGVVAALAAGVARHAPDGDRHDLTRFLAGALVLTAVWSVSDFRLLRLDFRLYVVLLAGIAFGLGLPRREAPCAS